MVKVTEELKAQIIHLYDEGLNCVEIKKELGFKHHQPVLKVLNTYSRYIPYRNGRSKTRIYKLNEDYFSVIDTEEKAYILGFLCADGHVDTKHNRLRFLVQTLDRGLLEKIRYCMKSTARIKDIIRESSFTYGKRQFYQSLVEFCSKDLISDLKRLGLVSNKTPVLNSSILQFIPNHLIRHFLRGYFDGDGSIVIGKDYKKICVEVVANLEFLENTFCVHFPTNTKILRAKQSAHSYYYRVTKRSEILKFLHFLYKDATIYLERKQAKYIFLCGHLKPFELLEPVQAISSETGSPPERSETIEQQ